MVLRNEHKKADHIKDAIKLTAHALGLLRKNGKLLTEPPASCHESSGLWKTGETIYE